MDSFRDNWWGSRWGDGDWRVERYRTNGAKSSALGHAEFLSTSQRKDAQDENAHLNSLPVAGVWLGQRAIAYVKAHPEDIDLILTYADLLRQKSHYVEAIAAHDAALARVSA